MPNIIVCIWVFEIFLINMGVKYADTKVNAVSLVIQVSFYLHYAGQP